MKGQIHSGLGIEYAQVRSIVALASLKRRGQATMPAPVVRVHDDPTFLREAEAVLQDVGIEPAIFHSSIAALLAVEEAETVRVPVTRDNVAVPRGPNGISLLMVAHQRVPVLKAVFGCSDLTQLLAAEYGVALNGSASPADVVGAVQELLE